jgi:hypothetical protein
MLLKSAPSRRRPPGGDGDVLSDKTPRKKVARDPTERLLFYTRHAVQVLVALWRLSPCYMTRATFLRGLTCAVPQSIQEPVAVLPRYNKSQPTSQKQARDAKIPVKGAQTTRNPTERLLFYTRHAVQVLVALWRLSPCSAIHTGASSSSSSIQQEPADVPKASEGRENPV